jgi:hypothetical protein
VRLPAIPPRKIVEPTEINAVQPTQSPEPLISPAIAPVWRAAALAAAFIARVFHHFSRLRDGARASSRMPGMI